MSDAIETGATTAVEPVAPRIERLRPRHFGELVLAALRDPLDLLVRMSRVDADVVDARIGRRRILLLQSPSVIGALHSYTGDDLRKERALRLGRFMLGEGLVTSEGALHRRQRRLILPAFHRAGIERAASIMYEEAVQAADRWESALQIDVHAELERLTIRVVTRALFGTDPGSGVAIGAAVRDGTRLFDRHRNPFAALLNRLPLPLTLRARRGRRTLYRFAERMVADRRAGREIAPDLLSLLLGARDAETGEPLPWRQIRDEIVTILLAGHETVATALTWTWYLIARHPEVERRLHSEVDALPGGRPLGMADLESLVFVRQVVSESMRLFPPVWAVSREATADVTIGGLEIPRGTTVIVSQYTLHRDPRWWVDPERFDPDRFAPGAARTRRFTYIPFSGGPRGCVGEQFAWTECMLVLATLARRWSLRIADTGAGPVPVHAGITLSPARPVRMRLVRRVRQ